MPRIPLLVKFIFPSKSFRYRSIRMTNMPAKWKLPRRCNGKTEMWYAVEARPDAELAWD
jgi:hypothetical protein